MARAPGRNVFLLLLGASAVLISTTKTAAAHNSTAEALTTLAAVIDMATTTQAPELNMVDRMRKAVRERLDASYDSMAEQFLNAKMSRQCAFKLLKFVHGLRNFEPWTLRMIDASGKYPTGLFQGSLSDLGAYDQCIETVIRDEYGGEKVRAQYCNLYIKLGKDMSFLEHVDEALRLSHRRTPTFSRFQNDDIVHGVKIGLCIVHECKPEDIEAIAGIFITGDTKVTVTDCATNIPPEISTTQAAIIGVLGVIAFLMAASTAIDIYLNNTRGDEPRGTALTALSSFSLVANSKMLVRVTDDKQSDAYKLRFLHGMRFFSIGWVVLGHSYSTFNFTNMSRLVNALHYGDNILFCFIMAGYLSVDTFLFLAGYLLTYNLLRERSNALFGTIIAIIRRYIRGTIPIFFCIMCTFIAPLMFQGPTTPTLYKLFYKEIRTQYWALLLQIRNFTGKLHIGMYGHLWYMSTDFQLFVISVIVIQFFKKKIWTTIIVFGSLSLIACSISAWQVSNTIYTPFVLPMADNFTVMTGTLNKFYTHPSYHGVAFFFGAMTQLFLFKYPSVKISKMFQAGMWLMSAACGLTAILIMYDWNRGEHPPEWAKLSFAFSERLLWSVWLSWLTFACSTGRGGFIAKWLSWSAFVPFSRLSFGVYLLHVPYYYIRLNITRERIFFSHYSMVTQYFGALVSSYLLSYILFVACEAPTGRIEKLLLMPKRRPQLHDEKSTVPYVEDKSDKLSPQMLYKPKAETGPNGTVAPPGQSSYL
ncbi:nose resistant to fluoxetine protein 6-like [Dermacentor andersoni]|uniref:nose resistant to fluoxetine protein 6-like n=1 Tax=Dermacentor andersoni TaxID=34620 RepID=UPI002155933B|nr:nose resistant to fluoxetine protein 6-like [Dermacentor andersoni]